MIEKTRKSKQILGVGPNTWGAFDSAVSYLSKSRFIRVLFSMLAITIAGAGCTIIENNTQVAETSPMPANTTIAKIPFVEVTPSLTVVATEKIPNERVIQIDVAKVAYPPAGSVKENFEMGEYDGGLETITQWVSVWEEMGVFKELGIENNRIGIAPLDGRARVVCVDTRKPGEWMGTLLCPPLDLINGGLKSVPADGKWDETDKPLVATLGNLDELISRGSDIDLAYQYVDKYQNFSIKYVDPKTSLIVIGEYLAPSEEIVLPEIVPESMNQIEELSFNMEFKDPKAAYRMLLETVIGDNLRNQQFWQETLGTSAPTIDQLLAYARNNVGGPENKAYWLPFNTSNGTKFNFLSVLGYDTDLHMRNPEIDGVYIDGIYSMFFIGKDLRDPAISDFVEGLRSDNKQILQGLITNRVLDTVILDEFGLLFVNNRFVFVAGGGEIHSGKPSLDKNFLGGSEWMFRADIDPAIVSAQFLSYLDAMAYYDPKLNYSKHTVCVSSLELCPGGIFYGSLGPDDWVVKAK